MMKRMLSTSRVPLLVLLLSGCGSPWKSAEGDVAMQIPPSVRTKVDSMEGAPGRGRLLSIRRRVDDVATGNFGMHFFSNSELNFGVQERALKVAEVRRWAPPDAPTTGALVANVSSICGLIDILREEQDAVRGSIDLAVGGAVITQSSTAAMIRRSRLNDIESSSSICSPVAGASFTYRVVHAMHGTGSAPRSISWPPSTASSNAQSGPMHARRSRWHRTFAVTTWRSSAPVCRSTGTRRPRPTHS
jgi:hypothetical protein